MQWKFVVSALSVILFLGCDAQVRDEKRAVEEKNAKILVPTCLWPIPAGQYKIDLTPHTLPERRGDWEIEEFPRMVYLKNNTNVPMRIHAIKNEHFCDLYDAAVAIAASAANCTKNIPALRIYLASKSDFSAMELIYEPVALCHVAAIGNEDEFVITAASSPKYYVYTGATFTPVADTSAAVLYRENQRIKRSSTATVDSFDKNKDVRTLIFAFQEIGKLIYDNAEPEVTVWSAITKKKIAVNDSSHSHSILMGPKQIGPAKKRFLTSFNLVYANLAHLCPANCVRVRFLRY